MVVEFFVAVSIEDVPPILSAVGERLFGDVLLVNANT